MLTITVQYII